MLCPTCGHDNPQPGRFCVNCGARIPGRCPSCGADTTDDQRFCAVCGFDLGAASPAAPADHTPAHLARRIAESREALIGERKHVTVMFADIVGSTSMVEEVDPEEAEALLTPAVRAMMEAVHRYEGTVNEVLGDGIMALFGAPIAHEDHAVRAAYAALDMPRLVERASEGRVSIRVGMHSGEVLVRSVDNDLSMDYHALGPTVHIAARMEQTAQPGTIQMTQTTAQLAEGFIATTPMGPYEVKGVSEPIEVLRVDGKSQVASLWEARAARGLTTFVGRQLEIDALGRGLEAARTGRGQVVAIVGDAGVGKSRLAHEFLAGVEHAGVLEGGGSPYDQSTPYYALRTLTRTWLNIDPNDNPDTIRAKVADGLEALGPDLGQATTPLVALLDVDPGDPEWEGLAALERRRRTREAFRAVVLGTVLPAVVVLIEDLHWIDADTQRVLDDIMNVIDRSRLFLVVTHRPYYRHDWAGRPHFTQLSLEPFAGDLAAEFLDALLGTDPSLDALKPLLIERSEGTALFLEETVRSLVEAGSLSGAPSEYRAAQPIDEIAIPSSVLTVLASRLDLLDPADKEVLQVASIIGEDVPLSLLQAAIGDGDGRISRSLMELEARELLYERQVFPARSYTFKHNLTREVAYGAIPLSRRRELHSLIADQLAATSPGDVERLARHAQAAGRHPEAATYALAAAEKALERSAYLSARKFLNDTVESLDRVPESDEARRQGIKARLSIRTTETGAGGSFLTVLKAVDEARELAEELGDDRVRVNTAIHQSYAHSVMGRCSAGYQAGEQAWELAEEVGDEYLIAESQLAMTQACAYAGRPRRALELVDSILDYILTEVTYERRGQVATRSIVALGHKALALAHYGSFAEAHESLAAAREIVEVERRPFDVVWVQWIEGYVSTYAGRPLRAIAAFEETAEYASTHDVELIAKWVVPQWARALMLIDKWEEAEAKLREGLAWSANSHLENVEAWSLIHMGKILEHRDQVDEAFEQAEAGLELARRNGLWHAVVSGERLLARLYGATGRPEEARGMLKSSLEIAEREGQRTETKAVKEELV